METLEKEIQDRVISPLGKAAIEVTEFREKYINFQLQLISISGATFSIYLAFGKNTSSTLTKWGFVFLAISLIFGLFSIILRFLHNFSQVSFKIFDIEKSIFSQSSKDLQEALAKTNYSRPLFYDKEIDHDFLDEPKKTIVKILRKFLESSTSSIASMFGVLQLCAILVASILLLIGLLQAPVL